MNQETKQRIVGAIVLLALASIFLPLVLDGDGDFQPEITSRIPPTPRLDVLPEPTPQRPVIVADSYPERIVQPIGTIIDGPAVSVVAEQPEVSQQSGADATTGQPDEIESPESSVNEPVLDALSLPQGWSVRLGVFSNSANATNLVARLLDAGYRAYARELPASQGVVTGVFVGPQIDRAVANRLKVELQEEFQLAGLVVRFEVDTL